MDEDRLPTALWVDAHLQQLNLQAIPYYIVQKGAYASGTVILKLVAPGTGCRLLQQQRDLDGVMGWMNAFKEDVVEESRADDYIQRATSRDPDLWAIEIEGRDMSNPFEGKTIEI